MVHDAPPLAPRAFGLLLGALRRRAELHQDDLAEAWGVSVPTIKRTEAGRSQPPLDGVLRLAAVLGIRGSELVAAVEALTAHLASYSGPVGGTRRRRPGDPLERFVEDWLDGLLWEPLGGDGLLPSFPRRLRPHRRVQGEAEGAPGSESLAGVEADLAVALLEALRSGRPRVGARVPPAVDAGRVAAQIAIEAQASNTGVLPLLFVSNSAATRAEFLRRARDRFEAVPAGELSTTGGAQPELAVCSVTGFGRAVRLEDTRWRLVLVDGLAAARRIGLKGKGGVRLSGVVGILDTTLVERPSALRALLGRAPDFTLDVDEAMARGLMPPLDYRGLPDPVDHRALRTHLGWTHPGEKGQALSRDERLEAVREAGAFGDGQQTVVHVADAGQAEWATAWLDRCLTGRARERVVVVQRALKQDHSEAIDELVLLAPEFPQVMIRQIAAGLGRADPDRGLVVWDLLGNTTDSGKRLASLLRWLGEAPGVHQEIGRTGERVGQGGWSVRWEGAT